MDSGRCAASLDLCHSLRDNPIIAGLRIRFLLPILFLAAICRKVWIGQRAMGFVRRCSDQVSFHSLFSQPDVHSTLASLPNKSASLVMFLNQHALNMTFNWLCNTQQMDEVHSRLLLITLDQRAKQLLAKHWPRVRTLRLDVPCLEAPFTYGDGAYQLFFVLRANFARALATLGKPFWMVQQDTFWRTNLLELDLDKKHYLDAADILFDRADSESQLIAGGHFFVRPTPASQAFFARVAKDLSERYTSDNAWMSSMCALSGLAKCALVPFDTIANWLWLYGSQQQPAKICAIFVPALIQFDGDTRLGSKLDKMASMGFCFVLPDGLTCNPNAVEAAKRKVEEMACLHAQQNSTTKSAILPHQWGRSYSQWQFSLYQTAIGLLQRHHLTEWILNTVIYPNAHYFMLTI